MLRFCHAPVSENRQQATVVSVVLFGAVRVGHSVTYVLETTFLRQPVALSCRAGSCCQGRSFTRHSMAMKKHPSHYRTASRRDRVWRTFMLANCLAIVATGVVLRAWRLDHVPGVNGDEAWMGVQALRFLDGDPVAWFTPTGNLVNVFHLLPQIALHALLPASVTVLRLTVLFSGILALVVNYILCRRAFGRRLATISTVILAVLPVNIAYSRFAWDASQSLLFTLPVVYGSLIAVRTEKVGRWLALAAVAQLAALVVHPTNIFVAPVLMVATITVIWGPLTKWLRSGSTAWRWCTVSLTSAGIAISTGLLLKNWLLLAGQRLVDPVQMSQFVRNYVDFFSGNTVYQFIVGTQRDASALDTTLYRLAGWFVMGCIAVGIYRRLRHARWRHWTLFSGVVAMTFGLYLVAGPLAIAPTSERYGICLIAATAIVAALGISWWIRPSRRFAAVAWLAVAWAMLVAFYTNYSNVFLVTGGEAHRAFRTAMVEPKLAALLEIRRQSSHSSPVCIVANQWWSYWPASYFTHQLDNTFVVGYPDDDPLCVPEVDAASRLLGRGGFSQADLVQLPEGAIRDAALAGSIFELQFVDPDAASNSGTATALIRDAASRPLLSVQRTGSR